MIETIHSAPSLAERIRERIEREGPITFCDWMRMALYDEREGYYCRSDWQKWGREGDYRTSPERSLLFAATFARYFARLYEQLGCPSEWTIVEVGAGDGRFASGVLETFQKSFPSVFSATRYLVDETSSHSRSLAKERLEPFAGFQGRVEFRRLADVEVDPGIVFSNELLDAFPVHRVIKQDGELREFYVGVNEVGSFEWLIGNASKEHLEQYFAGFGSQLSEGQIIEVNPGIEDWLELVSQKIRTGYLVTVDYGAEARDLYNATERREGTLRAFHRHRLAADVLASPGDCDITSTINWTLVKKLGERNGFDLVAFDRQDRFLLDAGLLEELELRVKETRREAEKLRLRTLAREMILPGGMAESFQVLVQKKSE